MDKFIKIKVPKTGDYVEVPEEEFDEIRNIFMDLSELLTSTYDKIVAPSKKIQMLKQ